MGGKSERKACLISTLSTVPSFPTQRRAGRGSRIFQHPLSVGSVICKMFASLSPRCSEQILQRSGGTFNMNGAKEHAEQFPTLSSGKHFILSVFIWKQQEILPPEKYSCCMNFISITRELQLGTKWYDLHSRIYFLPYVKELAVSWEYYSSGWFSTVNNPQPNIQKYVLKAESKDFLVSHFYL